MMKELKGYSLYTVSIIHYTYFVRIITGNLFIVVVQQFNKVILNLNLICKRDFYEYYILKSKRTTALMLINIKHYWKHKKTKKIIIIKERKKKLSSTKILISLLT